MFTNMRSRRKAAVPAYAKGNGAINKHQQQHESLQEHDRKAAKITPMMQSVLLCLTGLVSLTLVAMLAFFPSVAQTFRWIATAMQFDSLYELEGPYSQDQTRSASVVMGRYPGLRGVHSSNDASTLQQPSIPTNKHFHPCRYDGHCPIGSTCAILSQQQQDNHNLPGICEVIPFSSGASNNAQGGSDTWLKHCAHTCQKELEMDEHFYQEKWPVIEWADVALSQGRPDGCLLVYHRQPEQDQWNKMNQRDKQQHWKEVPPSIRSWDQTRFHHVVRVDPYDVDNLNDNRWMAYCYQPCQQDADCATRNDSPNIAPAFVCQEGACMRNNEYWQADLMDDQPEMVIVTGANSQYSHGLGHLAASLRYWAPHHKLVVYNLGGLNVQRIEQWSNVLEVAWPDGVPSQYPPHVSRGKQYAWKPIILQEALVKYKAILWIDAGSTVAGPIAPVEKILQHTGIFLVKGQDLSMRLSFPGTYHWFNTTKENFAPLSGPHFSGNTQAYLYPSRYFDRIVQPNAACALDAACINPPGANLANHRFDQTTLSILAYQPKVRAPHYTEFLAAEIGALNGDLTQASFKFIWTSRQGCGFYLELERQRHNGGSGREGQLGAFDDPPPAHQYVTVREVRERYMVGGGGGKLFHNLSWKRTG